MSPPVCPLVSVLQAVLDAGISSIAVVLKHAAIYPEHEKVVGQLATDMGFKQVGSHNIFEEKRGGGWTPAPVACWPFYYHHLCDSAGPHRRRHRVFPSLVLTSAHHA